LLFGGELGGCAGEAVDVFAVPGALADSAEGVLAFGANRLYENELLVRGLL